ncbi:DUF2844 domain-containing protein [Janthinobacterium sp. NFX145]|uniref:DUF2844 domain-containing protein n=1 Tax=Janthinobacterium sp. NFX145 TaxID=3415602 RepID=UPI003CC514D0
MKFFIFFGSACMSLFLQSTPAFAALGAPVVSLASSAKAANGAQSAVSGRMINYRGYVIDEKIDQSGTAVREYINADNVVFAVSWQGPNMPDLRQLLGSYADQYAFAASQRKAGQRGVAIQSDQLVLRSGGHIRSFAGSAYVPGLLPQGVTSDDIR